MTCSCGFDSLFTDTLVDGLGTGGLSERGG